MHIVRIDIPYGRGHQVLELNEEEVRAVIRCTADSGEGDEQALVEKAIANPIESPRLRDLAAKADRILVITSDHTRPVPSHITLPALLKEARLGNPDVRIKILVATGVHRQSTKAELEKKFGKGITDKEEIHVHNAFNDPMVGLGKLDSGCDLFVNELVAWPDLVISDGFIEPHFFAGFSGGRKSILPGVSSAKSIMSNHCAKLIDSPFARTGILEGNPIHKDMTTAARLAGLRFIVNVVLDDNHHITAAFAGNAFAAHEAGCAYSRKLFLMPAVLSSVAITSNGGYPLDQNVYQSVKSMTAGEACVKQGGYLICASECADGNGSDAFVRWFAESSGPDDVLQRIRQISAEETIADQWQAQILARVMLRAHTIMVCREENRAEVESMGLIWMPNVNDALAYAKQALGNSYDGVTVIPNGVSVIIQ